MLLWGSASPQALTPGVPHWAGFAVLLSTSDHWDLCRSVLLGSSLTCPAPGGEKLEQEGFQCRGNCSARVTGPAWTLFPAL